MSSKMSVSLGVFDFSSFLCFSFIVVLSGGTLWHFQRLLQCIKCIILEFTPSTTTLYPPSLDSWNSFNRYHFCIYMHVYTFFCTIFTLLPPFSTTSFLPLVLNLKCLQTIMKGFFRGIKLTMIKRRWKIN
jgi:hypothetical protein